MKRILPAVAAVLALSTTLFSSCGKSDSDSEREDSIAFDTLVHKMDFDLQMLSAAQSYEVTDDTLNFHIVISAEVQWPVRIGNNNITSLQDSIVAYCFPEQLTDAQHPFKVRHAMVNYVRDVNATGVVDDGSEIKAISEVYPDSIGNYSVNLEGRVIDFGRRIIAYQIAEHSFLGGAHPNTASHILSYDLEQGRVITAEDIIPADRMNEFALVVMKQLAAQLGMSPAELRDALLSQVFTVSSDIYVTDSYVYVHYNPYEILPYAYGTINVEIAPYEVATLLTPYARRLLLE